MNQKIKNYMDELKIYNHEHPYWKKHPLRVDREQLGIAEAVISVYRGIDNPTEEDKNAHDWAVSKLGLAKDIIHR